MSPSMEWMLIVWGAATVALIAVLIYRSTLEMHEDDQIFLSEGEKHMEEEQRVLQGKISRVQPWVKSLGAISGVLFLVMASMVIYDGIQRFNNPLR